MANSTKRSRSQGKPRNPSEGKQTARPPRQEEPRTGNSEILLLLLGALVVFLFLCNFGICGAFGNLLRFFLFGVFGLPAYITPPLIFLAAAFWYANQDNRGAGVKLAAGTALFFMAGMICELFAHRVQEMSSYSPGEIYMSCGSSRNGGGIIAGSLAYAAFKTLSIAGTILVLIAGIIICVVLLTEKSFIRGLQRGGRMITDQTSRTMQDMQDRSRHRREIGRKRRMQIEEERRLGIEQKEDEQILRRDRKVSGVSLDTQIEPEDAPVRSDRLAPFVPDGEEVRDDMHEITVHRYDASEPAGQTSPAAVSSEDPHSVQGNMREVLRDERKEAFTEVADPEPADVAASAPVSVFDAPKKPKGSFFDEPEMTEPLAEVIEPAKPDIPAEIKEPPAAVPKETKKPRAVKPAPAAQTDQKKPLSEYVFPPMDLLHRGKSKGGDSEKQLKDTAERLEEILKTFGVNARVTDISQGPTVTRYELQPEAGVKVSKILGLADDIKLNLAATDIRIEAPIPGKAAVGIEVPNKTNEIVYFRDVVDTPDFKAFKSKLVFGAGKDLEGKPVVANIAKMPHVLIAGATGSGKSVCINTIIMSILYKARPDEVQLIMIDPKVVELSVYNGIPHLLIPVVTEPQKAAAALNWAVAEMTRRYKLFADTLVRDLEGYNSYIDKLPSEERTPEDVRLPQILVIVDELADLMMTCAGEVETAIVRLTQLARAAGIHLVIATQRPSVDVITGLIKANMPSRIAFAVTSGVDSKTILDMVGAERLLGKGDMLFFPQGYTRPARVQGAFVSDEEVADVVSFIKQQGFSTASSVDIETQMKTMETSGGSAGASDASDGRDAFFEDAARLVIGKDKASISMLQRVFKVGFNRSARIMDQLCEAGVVSEEEGTKPRRVLMSEAQFEAFLAGEGGSE